MNSPGTKQQYEEIAELVASLKEVLPILEKQMKRLDPQTTIYKVAKPQQYQTEECYYCECHCKTAQTGVSQNIKVQYTIIKQPSKQ